MRKTESTEFQEIFGASTVHESLNADGPTLQVAPEPTLPTDDALWSFLNDAHGKTAQRVEDLDFIKAVSGADIPETAVPAGTEMHDFLKKAPRLLRHAAKAEQRRKDLAAISEKILGDLLRKRGKTRAIAEHVRNLVRSAEHFVTGCLMEAAQL